MVDSSSSSRRDRPILVVDDDAEIRESLRELLEEEGFPVIFAGNGAEALEKLAARPTLRAVILDVLMPVMDGHEFAHQLQRHAEAANVPIVPIIAMTAGRSKAGPAFSAACRVLQKPFRVAELLTALRTCP